MFGSDAPPPESPQEIDYSKAITLPYQNQEVKSMSFLQKLGCILLGHTPLEIKTQQVLFGKKLARNRMTLEIIEKMHNKIDLTAEEHKHLFRLRQELDNILTINESMFESYQNRT